MNSNSINHTYETYLTSVLDPPMTYLDFRNNQSRRNHGHQRGHRQRPGHDVHRIGAARGALALHDDEIGKNRFQNNFYYLLKYTFHFITNQVKKMGVGTENFSFFC